MTLRACTRGLRSRWYVFLIVGAALVVLLVVLTPWNISGLTSRARPALSYAEALQRVELLRAQAPSNMNPVCRLELMTHERQVQRAIILVHGYTSCPQQFRDLGRRFYDLGYNVLIAPLPHHGLADRMTDALARLTAEELVTYADETVDIGQGLGDLVIMMGLSGGGVITAWAAQNRSDIDLALVISPGFGFEQIPTPLTAAVMNAYLFLPDSFEWWDPVQQVKTPPEHAYPRYSKHAIVEILRLGFATQAAAQSARPAANKIIVVLNANDHVVNNPMTIEVAGLWRAHQANLATYEFPAELGLGHDLIDPSQPDQRIDIVYPRLIELIDQPAW
jgi:esterase/lipase